MASLSDQLEEIEASISSNTNKSFAYSTLLYLQEQSSSSPASIQTLARTTPSLIPLIVADVHDPDEEISVQALKCLGFMIYHPSIIAVISVEGANLVLESLVKLITTTKTKSVCNLGVWCISVQQFSERVLVSRFDSLLQAVVHGLDNPFASLSTTFEAIQAVMRLAVQLGEKMRDLSHVWAPPIYRRLTSLDKRERDISERCLLKSRSLIVPPPLKLSKALVKDMRQTLLNGMKNLLNHGMKVQSIRAWGWFIHLLGSYALENRNLINDMLKIPKHTFSDNDPQLQIASQVAWEGLIDALIIPEILLHMRSSAEVDVQQMGSSKRENTKQANGFSKSVKLIMTPLIGIMSSKCDASVHASCFNTWYHLLHKLDSSINCSVAKKLVLQPFFEAVLQIGPDGKSISVWNQSIELLDDSILAKSRDADNESSDLGSHHLSSPTFVNGTSTSGKCSLKHHHIKWFPWELSQLDFHLKFIYILINQASKASISNEERSLAHDAALRLFGSISKGVQIKMKKSSTTYDDIVLCLNTMLKFIKNLQEEHSEGSDRVDLNDICLKLIEVVTKEIEPCMLGSPLYKMSLDLKHVNGICVVDETTHAKTLEMCSINYADMVSPIVYLNVLYFCIMAQSNSNTLKNSDFFQKDVDKYFKIILSSYEPLENFIVTIGLLYKHRGPSYLRIWIEIAKGLKDCISDMEDIQLFKSESAYLAICDLLCYPFIILHCEQKDLMSAKTCSSFEDSHVSLLRKLEFEKVVELWKSLYGSHCTSQFECFAAEKISADLASILVKWLDKYSKLFESANTLESSHEDLDLDNICVYGGVVICILEKAQSSLLNRHESNDNSSGYKIPTGMNNCLTLAIRFMSLLQNKRGYDLPTNLDVASRFYSALAHFISCLDLKKQDRHSFVEMISSPLLQWLAKIERHDESTNLQFQLVWTETLNCLRRSEPPLVFDSSYLELQSSLLVKTLDHPNPAISEPTISFWNSTYGDQTKLGYPQNLLHVLDKLSRNGRINLHKRTPILLERCDSSIRANAGPEDHIRSATHNNSSKRIGLLKGNVNHPKHKDMPCLNMKRKRLELTEHQKEVRRAQRGRERDCAGHGLGGIRTYTSLDFSQGNEDSQESQEIWNLESILDKSKEGI